MCQYYENVQNTTEPTKFRLNDNDCIRDEDFDEDDPHRDEIYRPKWEALSQESTEMLLRKLEPRAVFNGHAHRGCKKR